MDLQCDALIAAGVDPAQIYEDRASGQLDARPGLDATLKALRRGDTLVVWKLDRLGRNPCQSLRRNCSKVRCSIC
jgi:DNA invertase Pin-like site-specific DNA recombinase